MVLLGVILVVDAYGISLQILNVNFTNIQLFRRVVI